MSRTRLLGCIFVLFQSLYSWYVRDVLLVPVIASCVVVIACSLRIRIQIGKRFSVLGIFGLACAVAARSAVMWLSSEDDPASFSVGVRFAEFLLLVQAFAMLHRREHDALPDCFSGIGVVTLLTLSYGASGLSPVAQMGVAALSTFLAASIPNSQRQSQQYDRLISTGQKQRVACVVWMISIVFAYAVSDVWASSVPQIQKWLNSRSADWAGSVAPILSYSRLGSLDAITEQQKNDPRKVAIRVYSDVIPGYLRGRVFEAYSRSRWRNHTRRRRKWNRLEDKTILTPAAKLPKSVSTSEEGQNAFSIRNLSDQQTETLVRMEVFNDPHRGEMFFTPLRTAFLQGMGSFVALDEHGVVHSGLSVQSPYTTYVDLADKTDNPPTELLAKLLIPPEGIDPRVRALAQQVSGRSDLSTSKINAVRSFFQENFSYSTDRISVPPDTDALSHFLIHRPAAHCEYFASGAVTLLRLQGIPARFVTGYVVTELEGEYGDYWIARNENSHAWAEAYDEALSEWIIVEATPGMSVPDQSVDANTSGDSSDERDDQGSELTFGDTWFIQRWVANSWNAIADMITRGLLPLTILMVVALALWLLKGQSLARRNPTDRIHGRCHRLLRRLQRRLARHRITRRSSETLHQFASRLRQHPRADGWTCQAAEWCETYANMLYRNDFDESVLRAAFPARR